MKSFFVSAAILFVLLTTGCKDNSEDCTSVERVSLNYKDDYVPYKTGNEHLKFLHNNSDTQIFSGQGKEVFFIQEAAKEGGCPHEYESVRIQFKNMSANDTFSFSYERDALSFANIIDWNDHTFYKLRYKSKLFLSEVYNSRGNEVFVSGIAYKNVSFIGLDTVTNFVAFRGGIGILRIRINGENWDLLP